MSNFREEKYLGHNTGLGPTLEDNVKITHFLYADDTIFFSKQTLEMLMLFYGALYAFEFLTSIKINYSKIEPIPINLKQTEAQTLASMIGCSLTSFPITYLDISLSDRKLRNRDWQLLLDKIKNKLQN
jgi:hypothetical protein